MGAARTRRFRPVRKGIPYTKASSFAASWQYNVNPSSTPHTPTHNHCAFRSPSCNEGDILSAAGQPRRGVSFFSLFLATISRRPLAEAAFLYYTLMSPRGGVRGRYVYIYIYTRIIIIPYGVAPGLETCVCVCDPFYPVSPGGGKRNTAWKTCNARYRSKKKKRK